MKTGYMQINKSRKLNNVYRLISFLCVKCYLFGDQADVSDMKCVKQQ